MPFSYPDPYHLISQNEKEKYLLHFARSSVEAECVEGVVRILLEHYYKHLSDTYFGMRNKCLQLLSCLGNVDTPLNKDGQVLVPAMIGGGASGVSGAVCVRDAQSVISDYFSDQDPRVRTAAIKAMCHLPIPSSNEQVRLVDDSFGKISHVVSDGSWVVRVQAAKTLGNMLQVSPHFLEQTLDKKLMSDLRRKRIAHERAKELYASGEFSSGRKWADDAPKEKVDTSAVNLIASGACGAFVHGLEDEMYEVRIAAVDAFSALAQSSASFAEMCLDSLVDMFNDEIEAVRLQSIHVLRQISTNTLREDQLDTALAVLEDSSRDIREALHELLCFTNVSTKECIQLALLELLKNLTKYPTDRNSAWKCLKFLVCRHPTLVLPLVPELLSTHPYFHTPEPDMDDPACILHTHTPLYLLCGPDLADLQRLGELQTELAGAADFFATYLRCQLLLTKMLEETYKLVFLYNGLENRQLNLSSVSEKFLQEVESFQRLFVVELPHLQESFVGKLLDVSPRLSACKPGELVKILQTTLRQSGFLNLQFPKQVQRASATIIERGATAALKASSQQRVPLREPFPSANLSRSSSCPNLPAADKHTSLNIHLPFPILFL
ncbi:integrator complex subunit 4-like [Oncorhynchus clarkii lewisi]|uniref:integrator complex subunit 4-like n=1 Tax=Oncorhynchus clarkii lewisi TaxID=490388 RepID=UPI0039B904DE